MTMNTKEEQDPFTTGVDITEEEYNSKMKDHENQHDDLKTIERGNNYFKEKGYTIDDLWFDNNYNIHRMGEIMIYTFNRHLTNKD